MIVTKIEDNILHILEEAAFDDEDTRSITYATYEFCSQDAHDILEAIKYLNKVLWDDISRYAAPLWFDTTEEEGCYLDADNISPSKEAMNGGSLIVCKSGSGYLKGYEKYSGTTASTSTFFWWPLIAYYHNKIKLSIKCKVTLMGLHTETQNDAYINPLTGEVTGHKFGEELNSTEENIKLVYQLDGKNEITTSAKNSVDGILRIDDSQLHSIQSLFSERVKSFFGY